MRFHVAISLILFTTASNTFFARIKGEVNPGCDLCDGPDCGIVDNCIYGTFANVYCNRMECKKGPNSTCGGTMNHRGKCGDGLSCRCDVCVGCSSVSYECYERSCMPKFNESPYTHPQHYPYNKL